MVVGVMPVPRGKFPGPAGKTSCGVLMPVLGMIGCSQSLPA